MRQQQQLGGGEAQRCGVGVGVEVGEGDGRVTSDPADRLILSFRQPPLSLLFTSLNERWGWGWG